VTWITRLWILYAATPLAASRSSAGACWRSRSVATGAGAEPGFSRSFRDLLNAKDVQERATRARSGGGLHRRPGDFGVRAGPRPPAGGGRSALVRRSRITSSGTSTWRVSPRRGVFSLTRTHAPDTRPLEAKQPRGARTGLLLHRDRTMKATKGPGAARRRSRSKARGFTT
jgi:hypothetical protein